MNIKEWKKRLTEILKEHSDIGENMTGKIEVNRNSSHNMQKIPTKILTKESFNVKLSKKGG